MYRPTKDQKKEIIELSDMLVNVIVDNELQEFFEVMISTKGLDGNATDILFEMSDKDNYA
jgi:phenylpyruvate tautomerase PptA (4-oxalocrotonate tautomerase family)